MVPAFVQRVSSGPARSLVRRWSENLRLPDGPWFALEAELDRWRGPPLRFWWRDDDCIDDTPQLRCLLEISEALGLPVGLAVVPAHACASLSGLLQDHPNVHVLAHGWSHRNHASPGRPSAEFTEGRDAQEAAYELSDGRRRLADLFGPRFLPVQVPPYNHLASNLAPAVLEAGYRYVSLDRDFPAVAIRSRNVHADVIDWTTGRAAEPAAVVRGLVAALRLRRYGLVDRTAPIGVMTHHLVQDQRIWAFTQDLLNCIRRHQVTVFPTMAEIFP